MRSFHTSFTPSGFQGMPELPLNHYWVPCVLNQMDGQFVPLYNASNYPFCNQSARPRPPTKIHRGGWRTQIWKEQEDEKLSELVGTFGKKQWTRIAKDINDEFATDKLPKHCRERWYNYLDPELNSKT